METIAKFVLWEIAGFFAKEVVKEYWKEIKKATNSAQVSKQKSPHPQQH